MSQGPDKVIHFYPTNFYSTKFFQNVLDESVHYGENI